MPMRWKMHDRLRRVVCLHGWYLMAYEEGYRRKPRSRWRISVRTLAKHRGWSFSDAILAIHYYNLPEFERFRKK